MAVCLEGRLEIDSFQKNTPDKAFVNGHHYSDKAPGTAVLGVIGAAPAIWIGQALGLTVEEKKLWVAASWAGCAVLNTVLAAGFVCLIKLLWRVLITEDTEDTEKAGSEEPEAGRLRAFKIALWTTIFVIFGGMAWPYATMMFSHAQVIGCVAIGLYCLYRAEPGVFSLSQLDFKEDKERREFSPEGAKLSPYCFWAGFAFGWALNSEYTTGLIVFGTALIALGRDGHRWIPFLLGLIGPCLLIPLYSWATIGIPWHLPYSYQATFPEMKEGLYAIKWPNATVAWRLLFSPERGLIFWSPFLSLALFGYATTSRNMRLFVLTYLLPVLHITIISGRVWDWPAGPTFSARYLAPILPLLAIPCAIALRRYFWFALPVGFISLALTGIATITNATPSFNSHNNPLVTLNLPLALKLDLNPNVFQCIIPSKAISTVLFLGAFYALLWPSAVKWQKIIAESSVQQKEP